MKKLFAAFAVGITALAMFACSSFPTIQEQFETLCPIVNADLNTIGTSTLLNAEQQSFIMTKILPVNKGVCAAGAQINAADLKDLANTLLPGVVTILQAVPAFPQQTALILALQTFGPLALQLGEQIVSTIQAVTPASAPTAASTPLAGAPLQ